MSAVILFIAAIRKGFSRDPPLAWKNDQGSSYICSR